jgi:hypothetical protein
MIAIKIIGGVVAAGIIVLLVAVAPDIRRYLRIRSM